MAHPAADDRKRNGGIPRDACPGVPRAIGAERKIEAKQLANPMQGLVVPPQRKGILPEGRFRFFRMQDGQQIGPVAAAAVAVKYLLHPGFHGHDQCLACFPADVVD